MRASSPDPPRLEQRQLGGRARLGRLDEQTALAHRLAVQHDRQQPFVPGRRAQAAAAASGRAAPVPRSAASSLAGAELTLGSSAGDRRCRWHLRLTRHDWAGLGQRQARWVCLRQDGHVDLLDSRPGRWRHDPRRWRPGQRQVSAPGAAGPPRAAAAADPAPAARSGLTVGRAAGPRRSRPDGPTTRRPGPRPRAG